MGFITEEVVEARQANVDRILQARADRIACDHDLQVAHDVAVQSVIDKFCAPLSLIAITHAVQTAVAEMFVRLGWVSLVRVPYPIPAEVELSDLCAPIVLDHLRTIEPATETVKLYRNALSNKYANGCISVTFRPTLVV